MLHGRFPSSWLAVVLAGATLASAAPAGAADPKLPAALTFTAYDTGSSGFNIAVAVGKAFKEKAGTDLRVLPAGNDVARLGPLKAGRAQASAMGIGLFYAQEGVFEFASKDWGPQPLMTLLSTIDCNGANIGIAKDTGVTEVKGLKGKRVGFVVGSPALNQNTLAFLAFGGLTKDDVKIVEFASFGAKWKGMLNNEIDVAQASTISGQTREVETSPRGLVWPAMPHADKEGWARMTKVGPHLKPHLATCGSAGLSPQTPKEMATYPYPAFIAYQSIGDDLAHGITKAMVDGYDLYKDGAPGASGLAIGQQTKQWVIPIHPGAVKVYKAAGNWNEADEAFNTKLLTRQKVLADAWAGFMKSNPPADKDAFRTAWLGARKSALTAAGLEVIFD
ncbi:MAG: TAXI family TRAP transporter solute-binding subunit [Hyphomicrobiaceae bacterium]|nr:TAXI family TRAP transporter solute-binding subunit [Hyphomicrobiaceae bacterium]